MSVVNWIDYDCKLIGYIPSEEEIIKKIEYAYRTCYNTNNKMESESIEDSVKFIQDKMKLGHGSPLEHVILSMEVIIDRGILAEWTRHRVGSSYSVSSTRYIKYNDKVDCIMPTQLRKNKNLCDVFKKGIEDSCSLYQEMLRMNVAPQNARGLLPQSLAVKMVVTHNLREWLHLFDLRYFNKAGSAHPDFIYICDKMYKLLNSHYPHIFNEVKE